MENKCEYKKQNMIELYTNNIADLEAKAEILIMKKEYDKCAAILEVRDIIKESLHEFQVEEETLSGKINRWTKENEDIIVNLVKERREKVDTDDVNVNSTYDATANTLRFVFNER